MEKILAKITMEPIVITSSWLTGEELKLFEQATDEDKLLFIEENFVDEILDSVKVALNE